MNSQINRIIFIGLLLILINNPIIAQTSIDLELRPRTEYRHGYKTLPATDTKGAFFISQRSRLIVSHQSDKLSAKISFQDVRTWGEENQISDVPSIGLYEAWGQYNFSKKTSIRFGRQELAYDDVRLMSNLNWAQQGRSHDALLFAHKDSLSTINVAVAYNSDKESLNYIPYTGTYYRNLELIWYNRKFNNFNLSLIAINDGYAENATSAAGVVTETAIHQRFTYGTYLTLKKGKLNLMGTAYLQSGKDKTGKSIAAHLLSANATYKVGAKTSVTFGYDVVSGTDGKDLSNASYNKNNTFSPLYGLHHKYYGIMDNFYVGFTPGSGLQDIQLKIAQNINEKTSLGLHYHYFLTAADVLDPNDTNQNLTKGLGSEIDIMFTHKVQKGVVIKGGYSQLLATETMQAVKGGDENETSNWAWVMLIFKPKLL